MNGRVIPFRSTNRDASELIELLMNRDFATDVNEAVRGASAVDLPIEHVEYVMHAAAGALTRLTRKPSA